MRVKFTKQFKQKLEIKNYPFRGFFARFALLGGNLQRVYEDNNQSTDLFNVNTFIYSKDNVIRLSFKTPWTNKNNYDTIAVYAIDSISTVEDFIQNTGSIELDYMRYTKYLAFVIYNNPESSMIDIDQPVSESSEDEIEFIAHHPDMIHIMDIKLPVNINCSFIPYCQDKSGNYIQTKDNLVCHYNSQDIGKILPRDNTTKKDNLIDKQVGLGRLRESLTYTRDIDLNGSMTIKKSGLIQL